MIWKLNMWVDCDSNRKEQSFVYFITLAKSFIRYFALVHMCTQILHCHNECSVPILCVWDREMDPVSTTVLAVWFTFTMLMHSIFPCDNDGEESAELE